MKNNRKNRKKCLMKMRRYFIMLATMTNTTADELKYTLRRKFTRKYADLLVANENRKPKITSGNLHQLWTPNKPYYKTLNYKRRPVNTLSHSTIS